MRYSIGNQKLSEHWYYCNIWKFQLSLPSSRVCRSGHINNNVKLAGFQGRVQREYNTCPVGCYAGPYDQNEKVKLNLQLPKSKLDYKSYTEFIHDEKFDCTELIIGQRYSMCDNLNKIDSLFYLFLTVNNWQLTVDSQQLIVNSWQETLYNQQLTVNRWIQQLQTDSWQLKGELQNLTVDSLQLEVYSLQFTVDSWQSTVDSWQSTVDSRQLTVNSR